MSDAATLSLVAVFIRRECVAACVPLKDVRLGYPLPKYAQHSLSELVSLPSGSA